MLNVDVNKMSHSVIVEHVTKAYKMHTKPSEKLLDLLLPGGYGEDFLALRDVSLTADPSDVIGLIGVNGSGKSTLSNIIAGVLQPTSGVVDVNGDTSLIAISAGLNTELTGRENISLKCLMMGFSKKEIKELEPEIIDFAEIGQFIDQPVKRYSSGMRSRLGFAVSVNVDPTVLVIDEALSVGDQTFADKCLAKMESFKARGKTIFFVSHSLGQVRDFCQKAVWLEFGRVREDGLIDDVMPQYEQFLADFKKMTKAQKEAYREAVVNKQRDEAWPTMAVN
jgi:teichoic acid transport system ATP-binding protein